MLFGNEFLIYLCIFFAIVVISGIGITLLFVKLIIKVAKSSWCFGPYIDRHKSRSFFKNLTTDVSGEYEQKILLDGSQTELLQSTVASKVFSSTGWRLHYRKLSLNFYLPNKSETKVNTEDFEVLEIRIQVQKKFSLSLSRHKNSYNSEAQSNKIKAANDFLRRISIQKHFSNLPCSFDKFEIIQGELSFTLYEPRLWEMNRTHLSTLLQELLVIANEYDQHQIIELQILSQQDSQLCPYCRDPLHNDSALIKRCRSCFTDVHESCWNQNRECPTWGCKSTVT